MELHRLETQRSISARPVIECAQCGQHIFAPQWSEYVDDLRVRHLWMCEACDYQFETLVVFAPPAQA
jgi:hypothetical protein